MNLQDALNLAALAECYKMVEASLRKHSKSMNSRDRTDWTIDTGCGMVMDTVPTPLSEEMLTVLRDHLKKRLAEMGVDVTSNAKPRLLK